MPIQLTSPNQECGNGTAVIRPGDVLSVTSAGLAPGTAVQVRATSPTDELVVSASGVVGPGGDVSASLEIPTTLPTGREWFVSLAGELPDRLAYAIAGPVQSPTGTAPCRTEDRATTTLDVPVLVDVLANDSAHPGSGFVRSTLRAVAEDGTPLEVDAAGRVVVAPERGFYGRINAFYSVCTIDGICGTTRFSVDVDPGCTIIGTEGDDDLSGTSGRDVICGLGGDDVIRAGDGDDVIVGGPGNDFLFGDAGRDYVVGGEDRDYSYPVGGDRTVREASDVNLGGDSDAPEVTISTPADGATFLLQAPAVVAFECIDASEIAACTGTAEPGAPVDTSTPGTHTFSVEATDEFGNTSSRTVTYTVVYAFSGFDQPVSNGMVLIQAGRTIPLKWTLSGFGGPADRPGAVVAVESAAVACDGSSTGELSPATATGTGLEYLGAGQWRYNWKTAKAWAGTCRHLVITFDDGNSVVTLFKFR